jgi:hypothetical protein
MVNNDLVFNTEDIIHSARIIFSDSIERPVSLNFHAESITISVEGVKILNQDRWGLNFPIIDKIIFEDNTGTYTYIKEREEENV